MPRTANPEGRRQDILQALATMLEQTPDKPITTAALARQVGFSEAALYRHFPSKKRMYEALIAFIEDVVFSRVRTVIGEPISTADQCQKILLLVLTFAEKNPGLSRLLAGEGLTGEDPKLYSQVSALFDRLETQLKQCLREGEIREGLQTTMTTTAAAELMLTALEGKIRLFVRSGFSRLPTTSWQDQWQAMATGLFR
jgi:TetR/AcrR family transcriptional regulator